MAVSLRRRSGGREWVEHVTWYMYETGEYGFRLLYWAVQDGYPVSGSVASAEPYSGDTALVLETPSWRREIPMSSPSAELVSALDAYETERALTELGEG